MKTDASHNPQATQAGDPSRRVVIIRVLKPALLYFALVFGAGFVLGPIRILCPASQNYSPIGSMIEAVQTGKADLIVTWRYKSMSSANSTEHMYKEMVELHNHSELIKRAHFIAAQRTRKYQKRLGVAIIMLNVLIGSTLLKLITPNLSDFIIGGLSVLAAMLAGIQTFFNFQKECDAHLRAGDDYGRINRRLELLIAEYKDNKDEDHADLINRFKSIHGEYLKANENNKVFIPTDKDREKAHVDLRTGGRGNGALIGA